MPISERIKKIGILLLAGGFRWAHRHRHRLLAGIQLLGWPFVFAVRLAVRHLLPHPYRAVLAVRRILRHWGVPTEGTVGALFSRRALVHALVALLVVAVSVSNVQAHTTNTPAAGEGSVLFALLGTDEEGSEEVVDELPAAAPVTYWNPDALEPRPGADIDDINFEEEAFLNPQIAAGGAVLQPTLPAGAPSVAPRTRTEFYVVRSGDTIAAIANRFGVSINTILWENKLTARSTLQPGDRLTILPVTGLTHTVRRGDTTEAIAKRYGSSSEKILAWNTGALRVGEAVLVPDGTPVAPPAPRRVAPVRAILHPPPSGPAGTGQMAWPTAWRVITQYFRWRHSGLDIDGDYTTPLYAAEAGVVTHAGWGRTKGGYGIYVDIDHGNGLVTRYAHASKLFVSVGDAVARGQTLGMVGTTGRSTGTHVHFEVIKNGRKVNPLEYIR